ncbi:MAG: class I SAM-dependent methyltransferase [Pedobacter sp.]|nr:class I SAM-dependent methyltransferase [Pedobacter sp.]
MNSFKSYSKYYDYLYQDKDYNAEADFLVNLIKKYQKNAVTIIDLGCGTGKHVKLLAKRGFKVTGLDKSKEMIAIAKKDSDLEFILGDIATFKLKKRFDVVLSIFHVFSYLTTNEKVIKSFLNANLHLEEKGIFIIDVWHTPAVHSQIPEIRVKVFENEKLKIVRYADPDVDSLNNTVDVKYQLNVLDKETLVEENITENHHIRHFSKPEIELFAKYTGFKILHTQELLTGNSPSEQTWGVGYIMQKVPLLAMPFSFLMELSTFYF